MRRWEPKPLLHGQLPYYKHPLHPCRADRCSEMIKHGYIYCYYHRKLAWKTKTVKTDKPTT
jgi:hypothetical protein